MEFSLTIRTDTPAFTRRPAEAELGRILRGVAAMVEEGAVTRYASVSRPHATRAVLDVDGVQVGHYRMRGTEADDALAQVRAVIDPVNAESAPFRTLDMDEPALRLAFATLCADVRDYLAATRPELLADALDRVGEDVR